MERIKVAVSPFFTGESWTDELTNITFEPNARGLNVYSIPANLDLSNVRKWVRLNSLVLVEGNIGDFNEVEEIVVEAPKEEVKVAVEEPAVEAKAVEVTEEKKAPAKKAAPKKAAAKKTTKSDE